LKAFTHFSYDASGGKTMVVDVQGVKAPSNQYLLTDPGKYYRILITSLSAIHSIDLTRFGGTNCGEVGMKKFFETHQCNSICKRLGLKRHPSQKAADDLAGATVLRS
jgi:hypothetical protein